jgi:uncharacterized membrane-anchored protein
MFRIGLAATAMAGALAFGSLASAAWAADGQPSEAAEEQRLMGILQAQHRQTGDVRIPEANVTLHLGTRYYFLKKDEAKQVLKEWGNPPDRSAGVLGLVFPAGATFLDRDGWGGVVTYEPAGFISDKDADHADYQQLIDQVHKGEDADNAERKKAGFPSAHLVGWAQPPSYDKAHHFMIWARDIHFGDEPEDTLNYDVRVLGRRGFLSVNFVSTIKDLPQIRTDAAQLASLAAFDAGSAYTDYAPGSDKTAEYGVAGMVAAGLGLAAAKKLGLLALIAVFAKKGVVLIAAAFAALVARVKRLFKKDPSATA